MNIDIVNNIVSKDLSVDEKQVELINKFYWGNIKNHIYEFKPEAINIESVCVIYPNKYYVKKCINKYLYILRNLRKSKKYRDDSIKKRNYEQHLQKLLRGFYNIRKQNKFTN